MDPYDSGYESEEFEYADDDIPLDQLLLILS